MPETIAMTPPDLNGHQVIWEKRETEHGVLYTPAENSDDVLDLLVPDSYRKDTAVDGSCLGIGSLDCYVEAGVVHKAGKFAVKSAPFLSQDRMLDWLQANLMLRQAILSLPSIGCDYITRKIGGSFHKIKTPQYFGALSLDEHSGRSVVVMSDESGLAGNDMAIRGFDKLNAALLGVTIRAMESNYPDSWIRWDHYEGNWIFRSEDKTLVRLDLFGTKEEDDYVRP